MTTGGDASARNLVLARIRDALGAKASDQERRDMVAERLGASQRHLIPSRATKPAEELKASLRSFLEGQSATVKEVPGRRDLPAAIAEFLRGANLPQRVRMGEDAFLASLDWSSTPGLERQKGRAAASDAVGLSRAVAAAAETGTLFLASGAANPVTLGFLPETHIIVIKASDIVGPYESAFDRMRELLGRGEMPRTLNLISGPSRTADIGGRPVTGAHGPRRLCIVIVGDGG
jgi:L-lactate dehydrogenase complex protein LldG